MVKCAVPECSSRANRVTLHRFPNNSALGRLWIQAIGNSELSKIPYEEVRKKSVGVCRLHFTDDSYLQQTKRPSLREFAIPSLLLQRSSEPMDTLGINIDETMEDNVSEASFTLKDLKKGTMSPHLTCELHASSPHIRKSVSMTAETEKSPNFRAATCQEFSSSIVKKRALEVEEFSQDMPTCSSTAKRSKMDFSQRKSLPSSFKRSLEDSQSVAPKNLKRQCLRNLNDLIIENEQNEATAQNIESEKDHLPFQRKTNKIIMSPKAKQIFEAARAIKKQLYKKNKVLKRYSKH